MVRSSHDLSLFVRKLEREYVSNRKEQFEFSKKLELSDIALKNLIIELKSNYENAYLVYHATRAELGQKATNESSAYYSKVATDLDINFVNTLVEYNSTEDYAKLYRDNICRYITRPAIANERLKRNYAGDVVLQLKSPYRDGTTRIVLSPLDKIAGSDFEQPKVGQKGGGQDVRRTSCNVWPL